ncbi:hypothetical protein SESBI_06796 [Sesbania bispinosa]|nr:hypothetical protein SESBI_06796 [Sesbania bispinosa]
MPVSFKPPQGMRVSNTESEVAAYIFMSTEILERKEILARSRYGGKFGIGDRRSLQTLMPSHYVSNEVISLVVCMMTNYRYLMSDYAFCWYLPPKFMQQELWSGRQLRFPFLIVIEPVSWDTTFYELRSSECPRIAEFPVVEPEGLFQHPSSYNDCGVMVAKWMMDSKDENTYERITDQVSSESGPG